LRAPARCFLAAVGQRLPALPQRERIIEVHAALLERLHDVDQFVAGAFVAEGGDLGGILAGVGQGHVLSVRGPSSCVPSAAAVTAPSATRMRS